MKKVKIIILFILVLIVLGAINSKLTQAQMVPGFGSACIRQYSDCEGLYGPSYAVNLAKLYDEHNLYLNGLDFSDLETSLKNSTTLMGGNVQGRAPVFGEMCIKTSKVINGQLDLIPLLSLRNGRDSGHPDQEPYNDLIDLPTYNETDANYSSIRSCPINTEAQSAYYKGTSYDGVVWGCCPSDFQFVTTDNDIDKMGCCREGNAGNHDGFPVKTDGINCFNSSGNKISYNTSNNFIPYKDTHGEGLSSGTIFRVNLEGATFGCNSKCALIDGAISGAQNYTVSGSQFSVVGGNDLKSNLSFGLQCNKCFSEGEGMFVTRQGDANKVAICSNDAVNLVDLVDIINDNIGDTLAYYAAGGGKNGDLFVQCRAQGGTYTALGCIDTTPVGIITGLIRIALGTMGGVALLQLILVGLRYQQGDEAKIKEAREQLIATLTGLAVLVFSVLILRILGVNILDIIPAGTI